MDISSLIASLLVLRQKIHSFHWEVSGQNFIEIHRLLGDQYEDILGYVDRLAEYTRGVGLNPPSTLASVIEMSLLDETDMTGIPVEEGLIVLLSNMKILLTSINSETSSDYALDNIIGDLSEFLLKQTWFIESLLK